MSRSANVLAWSLLTPSARADWFRKFARRKIIEHRECLASQSLFFGQIEVHSYEAEAVDRFADIAIEQDRDDDEAIEAALRLVLAVSNAPRGSIPDAILYHYGCGPRVRAMLLKESWTDGKSGSVLAINGPGKPTLVEYFLESDRALLMDEDELSTLAGLPSEITIYRGAKMKPKGLRSTAHALSWTRDPQTARWFSEHGHGLGEPVVIEAQYPVERVLALWESSGREPEIVVDPIKLKGIRVSHDLARAA